MRKQKGCKFIWASSLDHSTIRKSGSIESAKKRKYGCHLLVASCQPWIITTYIKACALTGCSLVVSLLNSAWPCKCVFWIKGRQKVTSCPWFTGAHETWNWMHGEWFDTSTIVASLDFGNDEPSNFLDMPLWPGSGIICHFWLVTLAGDIWKSDQSWSTMHRSNISHLDSGSLILIYDPYISWFNSTYHISLIFLDLHWPSKFFMAHLTCSAIVAIIPQSQSWWKCQSKHQLGYFLQ